MLLLNPRAVVFDGSVWEDVSTVAIDRSARRKLVEWSDLGPHAVLADVPEQEVTLTIVQSILRGDVDAPRSGDAGELVFHTAPTGADSPRRRVTAQAVVLDVTHELSLKRGAVRTIKLVAISPDGEADPIVIDEPD